MAENGTPAPERTGMAIQERASAQKEQEQLKGRENNTVSADANATTTESTFQVSIRLPHPPYKTQTIVSAQDQAQDIRQSITDSPQTFQYSCFHLEVGGKKIPEFVDLGQVPEVKANAELDLIEDPYTEKDARVHILRVRELVGAVGDRTDVVQGIDAGLTLHDHVVQHEKQRSKAEDESGQKKPNGHGFEHAMLDFNVKSTGSLMTLLEPPKRTPPKTLRSIALSQWNPPPHHLRSRGHLLYLQALTNEGELYHITGHVSGFYVNKSSNNKFDPLPKANPKAIHAHSLLSLLSQISSSFDQSFVSLQELSAARDPLASFQLTNAIPASPWAVSPSSSDLSSHIPDFCRTQESYLVSGADNAETLRDWNEEFQTTRELPKETVQDRIFRERVASKLFADYNEAATYGAVLIVRGEVAPLNPTEPSDAHIFVYNNIFFSFGADGVGTFSNEGGDDAARVATGKDVMGIKTVNQLDIQDLSTPGTVVVDYLGKRVVAQSIVPGIFKQREPGEQQIDYGGADGRDVVTKHEAFVTLFQKLSNSLHIKKHPVWDKNGQMHILEASVETKGLLGTDGRKYALDLYRITPLDVHWNQKYWDDYTNTEVPEKSGERYPHRMSVLRPELIDTYWRLELREYVRAQLAKRSSSPKENGDAKLMGNDSVTQSDGQTLDAIKSEQENDMPTGSEYADNDRVDISNFHYAFNPDVFSDQKPQTAEEKEEWAKDEEQVKLLSAYLLEQVIPKLLKDLAEGEVGFPMDGISLSSLLHKRGINIRYLGLIAELANEPVARLQALRNLATHEMIARAFKHVANGHLRQLPPTLATSCLAHMLNCLFGRLDQSPLIDDDLKVLYPKETPKFARITQASVRKEITRQVELRFRFQLADDWWKKLKHTQMLREISLKLGLQLAARSYDFASLTYFSNQVTLDDQSVVKGHLANGSSGPGGGKKKKKAQEKSPSRNLPITAAARHQIFRPDDIFNIVPVIKEACPRSVLAEEALEAGRISLAQNQRELGQELLLESLSLHEQIYGILHAEVARVYYQLSSLFYGLEDKPIASELARKAVIVSERTLGVDNHETILCYLNLGIFEHATGNTQLALGYVRHALDLWMLVYGPDHPDSITSLNNAAVMLQHLKLYHESRVWFEASLDICERISGESSVNTATILFQLAQALALDQDSKAAVIRMRQAYNIFHSILGPDDRNTKEAETWLEQLTQNAVAIAKRDRQVRHLNQLAPRALEPQPPAVIHSNTPGPARLDDRSIEELLRYIESPSTKPSSLKSQSNPKRR